MSVAVDRLRAAGAAGVPVPVWLLVALAIADVVLRLVIVLPNVSIGSLLTMLTGAAGPLLLAAVVLLVAPARQFMLAGAVLLGAAGLADGLLRALNQPIAMHYLTVPDFVHVAGSLAIALAVVGGPILIAREFGRAASPSARLTIAVAAVIALVLAVAVLDSWLQVAEQLGGAVSFIDVRLAASMITQFVIVSWAYVLVAAAQRRFRLIAGGAALMLAALLVVVAITVVGMLVQPVPGTSFGFVWDVANVLRIGAWLALIAGTLRDVS
ncbi:MAG TPA: hypothetical protein VNW68_04100 [Candidatus Limnocylindria bacterium]|nr:hypothetical protein [Candidatus Limnocylindria bacterium]